MLKFFTNILGEDYSILVNETPQSKNKIQVMGSILFIPVVMWFLQGYLFSSVIIKNGLLVSLFIGLVSAFLIFLLEKAILMTPKGSKMLVTFRFILGLVIAVVGSMIVDDIFFHEDIEAHMEEYRKNQVAAELDSIKLFYEARILDQSMKIDTIDITWIKSLAAVEDEADGTGGTGSKGVGEVTNLKLALAAKHEVKLQQAKAELREMELKYDSAIEKVELESMNSMNRQAFLLRIMVLFDLIKTNFFARCTYLVFTSLFLLLEFIVVIIKSSYPETSYEVRVKTLDQISKNRAQKKLQLELKTYNPLMESAEVQEAERLLKVS